MDAAEGEFRTNGTKLYDGTGVRRMMKCANHTNKLENREILEFLLKKMSRRALQRWGIRTNKNGIRSSRTQRSNSAVLTTRLRSP